MKATKFIVKYLESRGVTDVFGYPGGMVTHLIDSLDSADSDIAVHTNYHEQASAFAACAYAQVSGMPGVAFATSGPGATNLLTGVCNAFFDSIPVLFITGQVNTFEQKGSFDIRQRGFQETDIVSMCTDVTKMALRIESPEELPEVLERAFEVMQEGRPGPVLLDIPMDVQRGEVDASVAVPQPKRIVSPCVDVSVFIERLRSARRPCVVCGMGARISNAEEKLLRFLEATGLPVVTTMPAIDCVASYRRKYGFIGAYGSRSANFIVAKADLVLSLGARLDIRQVGVARGDFAPQAHIVRVDVDRGEIEYKVHSDETPYCLDVGIFLDSCLAENDAIPQVDSDWINVCDTIQEKLLEVDGDLPRKIMREISRVVPEGAVVTTDVGQNQVWVAQSFVVKGGQRVIFSSGHGAMGYSIPAAIGAYYATGRPVLCITGDGGMQMNIQELAYIARENLPITICVLNNHALGMIRHFQEMYFDSKFYETVTGKGWGDPDFTAIAKAYGLSAKTIVADPDFSFEPYFENPGPQLLNIHINEPTYVVPKLEFGKPNQDQEPLLCRELYRYLMNL